MLTSESAPFDQACSELAGAIGANRSTLPSHPHDPSFLSFQDRAVPASVKRNGEDVRSPVQRKTRRTWTTTRNLKHQISQLRNRLVSIQEEEKRRISRELHDEAGQLLATSIFRLDLCAAKIDPRLQSVTEVLGDVREILTDCAARIHGLSVDLRPPMLDDLGLVSTIEWYVRECRLKAGTNIELVSNVQEDMLNAEVRTAAFRIVQEAMTNATKHGNPTRVQVNLCSKPGALTVSVRDDGKGFDPGRARQATSTRGSLGLVGMAERASLLNGTLRVFSTHGKGTLVFAQFPLTEHAQHPKCSQTTIQGLA